MKGGQAVVQEVLTSRHGTVFNSLVRPARAGEAYLLYDAQTMDAGANARMMLEVLDAGNWDDFRRALAHYSIRACTSCTRTWKATWATTPWCIGR